MELVLLGTRGIAGESILSVRAGQVRKQAPLSSVEKPFRFPCRIEQCGSVKVEVLSVVGYARGICLGGEPQDFDLPLKASEGAGAGAAVGAGLEAQASVSFRVQPTGTAREEEPRAVRKAQAKSETDRYLEEHKVLRALQDVLQELMKERPPDPLGFVARHFAERRAAAAEAEPAAPAAGPPAVEALPEPGLSSDGASLVATSEESVQSAQAAAWGASRVLELEAEVASLRRQVHEHRAAAAARGSEETAADVLRAHAQLCLTKAAELGLLAGRLLAGAAQAPGVTRLAKTAEESLAPLPEPRGGVAGEAPGVTRLAKTAEESLVPLPEPHGGVAGEAPGVTRLAKTAEESLAPLPEPRGGVAGEAAAAADVGSLRAQTWERLLRAAADGDLASALEASVATGVDALRAQTGGRLLRAATDGDLARALEASGLGGPPAPATLVAEEEEGQLPEEASKAAPEEEGHPGAFVGSPADAARDVEVEERLRAQTREDVRGAASDGALVHLLAAAGEEQHEEDRLREDTRHAVVEAAWSGDLTGFLLAATAEQDAEEQWRGEARQVVVDAAYSGDLMQVLEEASVHVEEEEALREEARQLALEAADGGEMVSDLADQMEAKEVPPDPAGEDAAAAEQAASAPEQEQPVEGAAEEGAAAEEQEPAPQAAEEATASGGDAALEQVLAAPAERPSAVSSRSTKRGPAVLTRGLEDPAPAEGGGAPPEAAPQPGEKAPRLLASPMTSARGKAVAGVSPGGRRRLNTAKLEYQAYEVLSAARERATLLADVGCMQALIEVANAQQLRKLVSSRRSSPEKSQPASPRAAAAG